MVYTRQRQWHGYDRKSREDFFDFGERQVARLEKNLEAWIGTSFQGRRALDYGCGAGRISVPLAQRCDHVYGLDLSPAVLDEAARNAERLGVTNVDWHTADRLASLGGQYNLLVSQFVFQHIPSRQSLRLLQLLVTGLQPGGVGAVDFMLRPRHPWRHLLQGPVASDRPSAGKSAPIRWIRKFDWPALYALRNAQSLNDLAELLAHAGVTDWHVDVRLPRRTRGSTSVILYFRKG